MIPPSPEKTPIVIIAHRGSGNHLERVFQDLNLWFKNIIVVGSEKSGFSKIIQGNGGTWISSDSTQIRKLWEEGIRSHNSNWYILIQDTEYLSAVLKEAIVEIVNKNPIDPSFYPFYRQRFFLKQRLKYNFNWIQEVPSGLFYFETTSFSLDKFFHIAKVESVQGELIHFGERTLNEAIQNLTHRADWLADRLYKKSSNLNKRMLVTSALKSSLKEFFKIWILKRAIREGFEGLVFCCLNSTGIILGHLRYWEKYIRSGMQIKEHRDLIQKILVIKVRGLGDAVLASPVLKNLKCFMPNVSISVLTFNFCKPLFENNPNIDQIYGLSEKPKSSELKKIIKNLSANDYDLIINLHARNFSSKLTKNIKSRWKINKSYFLREKFSDILVGSDHEIDRSSIERDLDCIRVMGFEPISKQPEIFVTDVESKWAVEYLLKQKLDPEKKIVMIHPAVTQAYRHWGLERFVELAQHLIGDCGYQVMGIFSPMEQSIADSFFKQVAGISIYVGPLRTSIALIQQADLMVDNDSGPSHISQALKVPTLVLVGPDYKNTYRDEKIYDNNYIFYKDVPCRDLFFSRCLPPDPCQNTICMDHSVEEVFVKVQELLES